MEVIAPANEKYLGSRVSVHVEQPISQTLQNADFAYLGLGKRLEANLPWAWDTGGLLPGDYTLNFTLQPHGMVWTETVSLQPAEALPPEEIGAHWTSDESDCCLVYYITQTAAERDIDHLLIMLDEQAAEISDKMQAEFNAPVTVAFIPRVLGHGGFTSQEITISYLDRNYTSDATRMILRHELAHILDGQLGGDLRPTILVEGVAVYISGGHFKPDPLILRSANFLNDGHYIYFEELVDNFYENQHEASYMEAGALVEFMTETWGWDSFSSFYRDIHPAPGDNSQSAALEIALQKHFNLSLDELEHRFLEVLKAQPISADDKQDVRLTVDYYNTIRRYQRMLDPSAYFLNAWILNGEEMRQRGITADYMRHPSKIPNLVLETMLQAAGENLRNANYAETRHLITAINQVLDVLYCGADMPFSESSRAIDYHTIVELLIAMGHQPQKIIIDNNTARTWSTLSGQELHELIFIRQAGGWELK